MVLDESFECWSESCVVELFDSVVDEAALEEEFHQVQYDLVLEGVCCLVLVRFCEVEDCAALRAVLALGRVEFVADPALCGC